MVKYTTEQLLDAAKTELERRLPEGWKAATTPYDTSQGVDVFLSVEGPQGSSQGWLVEAKPSASPRAIRTLLGSDLVRKLRALDRREILLVAPWLSPRSRELLTEEGISYLDLTGNARLSLRYPGLFIETTGSDKNPDPDETPRPSRGIRGAKVGSVIRVIVDVVPPLTVTQIAETAKVNPGYVTRVLDSLHGEGLIDRGPRGRVEDSDWPALLRRRAEALDLLASHTTTFFVSRNGATDARDRLEGNPPPRTVVTGSFAASRYVRKAAPSLLVAYTWEMDTIATALDLIPATEGADVALLRPENNGVFYNYESDDNDLWWAAPSQIAIDCLSGNGRMPLEGEALIEWMQRDDSWRKLDPSEVRVPEWVS
jgi:hypothetical protein